MILLWVSLLVVFLDRITKMAVVSKMTEGDSIPVFENIFHVTYVLNPGAAFGMLPHNRMFFLAKTGLVIDFFDFRIWPVFNVADIAICVGVGLILWDMLQNGFLEN